MWCRVLLLVVALTCTLQSEITADSDDLLCVVILSGLQKDDLNVDLIEKLQRHNINIDDINNRKIIEKCTLSSSSDKSKDRPTKNTVPIKTEQSDQTPMSPIIYNINQTIQVEESKELSGNSNKSDKENNAYLEPSKNLTYENFIKMWINKTRYDDNEGNTTKETEKRLTIKLPVSFEKENKIDSSEPSIDFINKVLEKYNFATRAATESIKSTTSSYNLQNQMDIVSQQIMKFLKHNNITQDYFDINHKSEETQSYQTSTKRSNINETARVQEIFTDNKRNIKSELGASLHDKTPQNNKFENFIELWMKSNKTNTGKTINTLDKKPKMDSQATDINLMLRSYYSQESTTTAKPTEIVAERIRKTLKNNLCETTVDCVFKHNYKYDAHNVVDENSQTQNMGPLSNKILSLNYELKIPDLTEYRFENKNQIDNNLKTINSQINVSERITSNLNSVTAPRPHYIEVLKAFMTAQNVRSTTVPPTTTPKNVDIILKQIRKFLEGNDTNHFKAAVDEIPEDLQNKHLDLYKAQYNDEDILSRKSQNEPTTMPKNIDKVLQKINKFLEGISNRITTVKSVPEEFQNRHVDAHKAQYKRDEDNIPRNGQNESPTTYKNIDIILQQIKNIPESNDKSHLKTMVKDILDLQNRYPDTYKVHSNRDEDIILHKIDNEPTTTPKPIDLILQQIKNFLESNDRNHLKTTVTNTPEYLQNRYLDAHNATNNRNGDIVSRKRHDEVNDLQYLHNQDHLTKAPQQTSRKDEKINQTQIIQEKDNVHVEQLSVIYNNATKTNGYTKELNHIFQMFDSYIAVKDERTSTAVPITTAKNIDLIAERIKEYLESNDFKYRKFKVNQEPAQNQNVQGVDMYNPDKVLITRKIDYITEIQSPAKQLEIADSSETTSKNVQLDEKFEHNENHVETNKNNNYAKIDTKSLPDEVIREITEKVKASVLKDLQKQLTSTLRSVVNATEATTTKSKVNNLNFSSAATDIPTSNTLNIDQTSMKKATRALNNLIRLFEQFKRVNDNIKIPNNLKKTLAPKGKTKNEFHGPVNIMYPSLLPVNYAYNLNSTRISSMPVFVDPYGLHNSNPVIQKTKITNEVKKFRYTIDPQNNMQSKMEHAIQASVIQTDDAQVPLLGIPVPKSVGLLNQNIIVTTKHPMIKFKEKLEQKSKVKTKKPRHLDLKNLMKYDTETDRQSDTDYGRLSDTELERHAIADMTKFRSIERGSGRDHKYLWGRYHIPDYKKRFHRDRLSSRSKQAHSYRDDFYQEYLSNIRAKDNKPWDFTDYSQERQRERFHEKLERPDECRPSPKPEPPKKEKQMNVASRQQLSIHDLKKKQPDDTHYIKFLQSQKRVNDMLEKILKPNNKIKSVEAI